jgi:hypothetical protein
VVAVALLREYRRLTAPQEGAAAGVEPFGADRRPSDAAAVG